jgi:radical SAM superfamily enzyme YgiQ (UPF0313 family)
MRVYLVNPSDVAFGVAVITPRWLYALAAATPAQYGDPIPVDETLEPMEETRIEPGDVVGIGIHTSNSLRGYAVGRMARARGAFVVFGGIHATLYPGEAQELGGAHAVVRGDGDVIWAEVLADCANGAPRGLYEGGRVGADQLQPARWDLLPANRYMWASVQTVRGCPKHCSFCSVWRTDGQLPRMRNNDTVVEEVVQLRRRGYRFIALADDNFYPVALADVVLAERQNNHALAARLRHLRRERFDLMERLAALPADTILFTQITMEAAEDPSFLEAMRKAHIKGALVGVEAVTPEGLRSVFKDFNLSGEGLVERLRLFRVHGVHVLGSFIFGLPTDRAETFQATVELAKRADLTFAQFVMMTPFPGTVDFDRWERSMEARAAHVDGIPITRYWLIPGSRRPKVYMSHSSMTAEEIRTRTQQTWDSYYRLGEIWRRAKCVKSLKARLAFVFISKLYRQMYADTGIATDSARRRRANRWARCTASICLRLFRGRPMPGLQPPPAPRPLVEDLRTTDDTTATMRSS